MKTSFKEIFSSIQGEGIYLGYRQIFIRFAGCNLKCGFCDEKLKPEKFSLTPASLLTRIKSLEKSSGPHHSISLTGGEPLLRVEFLREFLPGLRKSGFTVYLETNGTLAKNLKQLLEYFDIIAMDIKLPSSTGDKKTWKEHAEFLNIAKKKDLLIKVVVCGNTSKSDFKKAVNLVKNTNRDIPFIIQPDKNTRAAAPLQALALRELNNVRVIPQVHKIMGVR